MAVISINLVGNVRTYTISDAHIQRVIGAYQSTYDPDPTGEEIVDLIADGWVQSLVDFCRSIEEEAAADAARAGVTPISIVRA